MTASLICFDLGGVLLRICRSWAEGCRVVGLPVRASEATDLFAIPGWWEVNADLQAGRIDIDAFSRRFSALIDGLYSPAEIAMVQLAWIHGEYDGAVELVERLHDRGLETAALSNTSHEHWLLMPRFPSVSSLRHHFASHLMGVRKPDEEAYRAVERETGRNGTSIIFFDDSPENITAAATLGWHATLIDPHGDPPGQMREVLKGLGVL